MQMNRTMIAPFFMMLSVACAGTGTVEDNDVVASEDALQKLVVTRLDRSSAKDAAQQASTDFAEDLNRFLKRNPSNLIAVPTISTKVDPTKPSSELAAPIVEILKFLRKSSATPNELRGAANAWALGVYSKYVGGDGLIKIDANLSKLPAGFALQRSLVNSNFENAVKNAKRTPNLDIRALIDTWGDDVLAPVAFNRAPTANELVKVFESELDLGELVTKGKGAIADFDIDSVLDASSLAALKGSGVKSQLLFQYDSGDSLTSTLVIVDKYNQAFALISQIQTDD